MTTISDLKNQLEENIQTVCKIDNGEIKLRDDLTIGDVMNLKSVESAINNILVVAQTCAFADQIGEADIKNHMANPNAKGFDVDYDNGMKRILAELKATVPCGNNNTYGGQQAKSITTDLENLLGMSDKGKNAKIGSADDRYIVLIDVSGQRNAFDNLKNNKNYRDRIDKEISPIYVDPKIKIDKYENNGWK